MVMDYTTLFFAICSIAIGNVSGKLLAEGSEEKSWTKAVAGLVILVIHVIVLVYYYGVQGVGILIKLLKRLSCKHKRMQISQRYNITIYSKRVGDDNYIYECLTYECDQCGKTFVDEKLVKVEEYYYKELAQE